MISDDRTARVYGLEIAGLATRFYYRASPFISESIGSSPDEISYTDLDCIESISDYVADLEPSGGIATYSSMSVSLVMDRMRGTNQDSHRIFGRVMRSSSVWSGQLVQAIARDDDQPTIIVDSDPSLTYPHLVHIGAESFLISGQSQVGDVYHLTCELRIGFRQMHDIRLDGTDTPMVTSEIVSWRGRQASIYCASMDDNGIITDNQVIFHGMIERSPDISDLTAISISIVPISTIVDNKVAGPKHSTQLVHGHHYFDQSARYRINNIQKLGDNRAFIGGGYFIEFSNGLASTDEIMDKINSVSRGSEPGTWFIKRQAGGYYLVLNPHSNASTVHQVFTDDISLVKLDQLSRSGNALDFRYISDDPVCLNFGVSFSSSEAPIRTAKDAKRYQFDIDRDLNLYYYLYQTETYAEYQIRGVALGWYEYGEKYLLVRDSLGLPASYDGTLYAIEIKAYGKSFKAMAKSETAVSVGYIIELDQDNVYNRGLPSFGDFLDSTEKIEISRGLLIENKPAGEVMLELLESGGGGGINGAYDLHLVGCNIDQNFIDENSFLSNQSASNIRDWQFNLSIDDITARDILEPMLRVMGCAIVMDRSTFYPRLKLISVGHEADENQPLITDDTMLIDSPIYWSVYEDIITQFKFIYDLQNDQPTERVINNYSAINQLAGETRSEEYKLYGLTSEIVGGARAGDFLQYFRATYARLFRLYGQAIRQWTFSVTSGASFNLDIGSSLRVSSDFLKGYSDDYGITDQVGLIVSMRLSLFGEGCELKLNHYGLSSPTWNASARVDQVINSTTVSIVADQFSASDISFFKAGDAVVRYTWGANDTKTSLTISQINGAQIVFSGSHGATAGDIIQPASYTLASTAHKKRAYIDRGYKYE
jgi:hypothetical protein